MNLPYHENVDTKLCLTALNGKSVTLTVIYNSDQILGTRI